MSIERDVTNSAHSPRSLFLSGCSVLSPRYSLLSNLLRDVLRKGADCRFRAIGHSMSPFIKDGDVLTISPLSTSPRVGNIVAFINPETGKLTIHRVVGKKGDSYLIKGDNTSEADGLIQRENILGYVTRVERDGKKVFIGLGSERFLIAFLTRNSILSKIKGSHLSLILRPVWRLVRPFVRLR